MEAPPVGFLVLPLVAWLLVGVAILWAVRRAQRSPLVHRLVAVFVGLWALLATTAVSWVLLNGGVAALDGLLTAPPTIFTESAALAWAWGAAGALGVLSVAFGLNQLVGRSFLRLYRSERIPWPAELERVAGSAALYLVDLPDPDAFSYTLLGHEPGRGFRRRELVLLTRTLRARLTRNEEIAVLAHELGHVRELDSRYLTFLRTFSQLMRWDPVLGSVSGLLSRREELRADGNAVAVTHRPMDLARALYKAISFPDAGRPVLGAAGFLGGRGRRGRRQALERIRRLVALAEAGPPREGPGA